MLEQRLTPNKPATIGHAVLSCKELGRPFRRRLCKRLAITWKEYIQLEGLALSDNTKEEEE